MESSPREASSAGWSGSSPGVWSASDNVSGCGFVFFANDITLLSIIVFSFLDPEVFTAGLRGGFSPILGGGRVSVPPFGTRLGQFGNGTAEPGSENWIRSA